ncbi:MAG: peptide deformylase [Candidatus Magasanikbacteria bacterium]|nr:peptide deformylase [Candidatus Magasanikbacteria bacterium]
MVYDIVLDPNPILHQRAAEVDPAGITGREMQKFFKDMVETMYVKDGVGLAAVQIGVSKQVCTIVKTHNALNRHEDLVLVNPRWEKLDRHEEWDEEGCLSVPGMFGKIKRYTKIKVQALDKQGQPLQFVAENFFAKIVQHECDHLQGHLYVEKAKDLHRAEQAKPDSKYPRE